jgi:hypothetical protein
MRNPVALKASRRYCACRVGIRAERGGRWRLYEPHEPAEVFIRKVQLGAPHAPFTRPRIPRWQSDGRRDPLQVAVTPHILGRQDQEHSFADERTPARGRKLS